MSSISSVTKLHNTIFGNEKTDFDVIWHKWSMGQEHKTVNFEVRRSRSHEAEDRYGGLAETSFSTLLGRVGFLLSYLYYWSGFH